MQPEIDVFGPLTIQTFGLCFGLAFLVCRRMVARRLKELGRPVDLAYEMVFAALIGGIVGAQLWSWPRTGGPGRPARRALLGLRPLCTAARSAARWRCSPGRSGAGVLDLALSTSPRPSLAAAYAIGRIGCQLAGDGDYGKDWDGPWAMAYPDGTVPIDHAVHPTPIYETLAMGSSRWVLWRLRDRCRPGALFALTWCSPGSSASWSSSCAATTRSSWA